MYNIYTFLTAFQSICNHTSESVYRPYSINEIKAERVCGKIVISLRRNFFIRTL